MNIILAAALPAGNVSDAMPVSSAAASFFVEDPAGEAVMVGIFAGEAAFDQSRRTGVLKLFERAARSLRGEARFEALRAYAEFRRVFRDRDYLMPTASLLAAGFTHAQIVEFDASMNAWPRIYRSAGKPTGKRRAEFGACYSGRF